MGRLSEAIAAGGVLGLAPPGSEQAAEVKQSRTTRMAMDRLIPRRQSNGYAALKVLESQAAGDDGPGCAVELSVRQ